MKADLLIKIDEKYITRDQSISFRIIKHRTDPFFTWTCLTACKYLNKERSGISASFQALPSCCSEEPGNEVEIIHELRSA
jgi:hypothetical protein